MNQQQPTVPPTNQKASTSIKNILSLEEIQLTTQVASSQHTLHQLTETQLKEIQKHTKDI